MQVLQQARVDAVRKSLSLFVKAPLHTRMFVYKGGLFCSSWRDETGRLFPPPRVSGAECMGRCWACCAGSGTVTIRAGQSSALQTRSHSSVCVPQAWGAEPAAPRSTGGAGCCISPCQALTHLPVHPSSGHGAHWSFTGAGAACSSSAVHGGCRITCRTDAEAEKAL